MNNQSLVLRYFQSWQEPVDFEKMYDCLYIHVKIDAGIFQFNNRDDFMQFITTNSVPWKDVVLISSIYNDTQAAILYEGINTATNQKMRVSEHIKVENNKITHIESVITGID
ncbi:hypothetical protein GTQ40_02900 [Flavobacteriaceae bacterium R38]|nr:hypothetical protein [Flavobacteriaceae bacterium R38]